MSKKIIPFALPSSRGQENKADKTIAADRSGDAWVLATEPENEPKDSGGPGLVIDLNARRNWFELMGLIWAFPYIATWMWTAQALDSLSDRAGRK